MDQADRARAETILRGTGWLSLLPEAFRNDVLRQSLLLDFAKGETIYNFGDPLGGIYGLVAGTIAVNTSPPSATPQLIHIGAPGFWTGEGCFLTRQPRRVELRAITAARLMHLPLSAMDRMEGRDPNAVRYFARVVMLNVDILIRIVHDLQHPDTARRIAAVLSRAGWIGEKPIPLTQTELGAMANASRKQVNAVLRQFAKAGWILNSYRAITVLDPHRLHAFVAGEDQ